MLVLPAGLTTAVTGPNANAYSNSFSHIAEAEAMEGESGRCPTSVLLDCNAVVFNCASCGQLPADLIAATFACRLH